MGMGYKTKQRKSFLSEKNLPDAGKWTVEFYQKTHGDFLEKSELGLEFSLPMVIPKSK
jgi:hypothetical protein